MHRDQEDRRHWYAGTSGIRAPRSTARPPNISFKMVSHPTRCSAGIPCACKNHRAVQSQPHDREEGDPEFGRTRPRRGQEGPGRIALSRRPGMRRNPARMSAPSPARRPTGVGQECPSLLTIPSGSAQFGGQRSFALTQCTGCASGNFHVPLRISVRGRYRRTM
jgi:hypothetical protein